MSRDPHVRLQKLNAKKVPQNGMISPRPEWKSLWFSLNRRPISESRSRLTTILEWQVVPSNITISNWCCHKWHHWQQSLYFFVICLFKYFERCKYGIRLCCRISGNKKYRLDFWRRHVACGMAGPAACCNSIVGDMRRNWKLQCRVAMAFWWQIAWDNWGWGPSNF